MCLFFNTRYNLHSVTSNAVFDNCVIKKNITIQATTSIEDDIKTLCNQLLSLNTSEVQTYAGQFVRTGATFCSYVITVGSVANNVNGYVAIDNEVNYGNIFFVTRINNNWDIRPMIRAINSMGKAEISNRVTDGMVSFNFLNESNSGISIDVFYDTGYIIVYKVVNGVTVGTKSCILS